MIPKILHRVVPAQPSEEAERFWAGWQALHPDWEFRSWVDRQNPADFELGSEFPYASNGAQLADLVRLEVLWKFGGVYLDSDMEPVRNLEPLLGESLFICTEDANVLSTGAIGCTPRHPAIRACMDAILSEQRTRLDLPANVATGPVMATQVMAGRSDLTVLPPECFYPYHYSQPRPHDVSTVTTPFTYGVHHWAASWVPKVKPPRRSIKVRLRAAARQAASPVVRRLVRLLRRELDATPVGTFGVFAGNNRMIVTLPDGSPLICLADDRTLTPVLAAQGIHDLPYWRFLEKHLRPGDRVIEIGAGIGVFTTHIARRVGRFGSVVATESDPRNLEILRENLTCNKLIDRVTVRAGSLVNLSMDGSPAIPLGDLCRPDLPIHLLRIASQVHATRLLMELETLLKCGSVRRIAIEFGEATPDSERALLGTLIRRIATEGKFGFETLDDCGLPRVAPLGAASSTQGRRHHFFLTATNPQVPAS